MPSADFGWAEPALPDDAVEIGRIVGAWGIKGWFRVAPHAAQPAALFSSRRWFLLPAESAAAHGPGRSAHPERLPTLLRITDCKSQGDSVVAAAQEIADRSAAEALKGARVLVGRSSFPTAADGEYYWIDLIGLEVFNREGQPLGSVIDLLDTGAHSVLRLRRPEAASDARGEAAERLIPFVAAFIDDVDLAARRITVDWGLDY
jgi:16S rRNA processing protein RimM